MHNSFIPLKNIDVIIKTSSRPVSQSGEARTGKVELIYASKDSKSRGPLTGWITESDMRSELKLQFNSISLATAYAKSKNLTYIIIDSAGIAIA